MKNMEQQFSEDLMITQSSKSVIDSIPVDLLIGIFSRFPAKSIARFRCVSKFWKSILGRQDFKEFYLTKSVARPRIFFALEVNKEFLFFSTPQPQYPDETSPLEATPYKGFPKFFRTEILIQLYGLVFLQRNMSRGRKLRVICNPSTGESVTLPEVKATGVAQSHFGFDPINKQFKVLCTTWSRHGTPNTHCVLTLETGKLLWRSIQNPSFLPSHYLTGRRHSEICINGVVYYQARFSNTSSKIVSFDFRSESFGLINMDRDMLHDRHFTLFNYKGHLGVFWCLEASVFWVLEDAENHKWSTHLRVAPILGDGILDKYDFAGMTGTGELVFSPPYLPDNFRLFSKSIERNTRRHFRIIGFEDFECGDTVVHTFLDYVEKYEVYVSVLKALDFYLLYFNSCDIAS